MIAAKKIKHREIERSRYKIYLKKASEFYHTMLQAQESGNWNAVGLNGVHCAISACDAVIVFHSGIRSSSTDHRNTIELLNRTSIRNVRENSNTLGRIIGKKNIVEYEDRDFYEKEAREIIKLTTRFFTWTKEILPEN